MKAFAPLLLLAGLAAGTMAQEPLAPTRFAEGFAIEAPPGGALYRLPLTEPVYRALTRADLADLVVFNAAGEAVPQAMEPAKTAPPPVEETPLPYYPVSAEAAQDPLNRLQVTVDTGGSVVSVSAPAISVEQTRAWIVDAGDGAGALRGLRLAWDAGAVQFARAVTVYASNDLLGWYFAGQATLADLDHGGHRLHQDHIAISGAARFLRIDWPAGETPPRLQGVFGRRDGAAPQSARSYSSLRGSPAQAPDTGWLFDSGGPVPIDRLRVQLPGENNLAELQLWSRADTGQAWVGRGRVLAYRLYADGAMLESAEAELPLTRDRFWRIASASDDAQALGPSPEILLGWSPDTLLFVARGTGPFTLAAGSATAVASPQPVASLLAPVDRAQRESMVLDAWLGEQHALGGEQALQPTVPPVPWQRYLIWGLLLAGVGVMLRMAIGLLREGPKAAG
jgi:hypothetical protein